MSKATAAFLLIPALAALAWTAGQAIEARRLRDDLRELKDRLARVEARPKAPPPESARAVDELRAEIARVDAKVAAPPSAPGALPTAVTEEDIRKIVDERIQEKKTDPATAQAQGGGGDRKMPLHDMSKELTLDPETQRRVGEIANRAKKEIFDVLRTPRADGTEMAGELIGAYLSGDAEKTKQVFQRLFTEKVPGSDQTYLAAVSGVQERAKQQLKGTMGDALYGRYEHMNVHPENIETGWEPWGDYVKEKGLTPPK